MMFILLFCFVKLVATCGVGWHTLGNHQNSLSPTLSFFWLPVSRPSYLFQRAASVGKETKREFVCYPKKEPASSLPCLLGLFLPVRESIKDPLLPEEAASRAATLPQGWYRAAPVVNPPQMPWYFLTFNFLIFPPPLEAVPPGWVEHQHAHNSHRYCRCWLLIWLYYIIRIIRIKNLLYV